MNLSERERQERYAATLLANAIHETADLYRGNPEPVTDLYRLCVQQGRHEVVTEPRREA